jgi:hypothetical protein
MAQTCRSHNSALSAVYNPGKTNHIADFLSRSFHLSDDELLQYLNTWVPIKPHWKLVTPMASTISSMNLALSKKLSPLESLRAGRVPITPRGLFGQNFATPWPKTLSSQTLVTQSRSYKYSLQDTEWEQWLPPALTSKLERWRVPFEPWGRHLPHWDSQIPACNIRENWTYAYSAN